MNPFPRAHLMSSWLLPWVVLTTGCAFHQQIAGQIMDRNGVPVPRASISLTPGEVSIVTDQDGRFLIDYLREGEEARRVRLQTRQEYSIEVFKPGYHVQTVDFFYARGALDLPSIEIIEDSIEVRDDELHIDIGLYTNPTHSSGANYEGQ